MGEVNATPASMGDDGIVTLGITLKGINAEKRTADFVASTDAIDSYNEIVDQSTWELDIYRSNPVALFAHKSRELPIGRSTDVMVRNGRLECTIEFATEEMNPEAERVWKMVQGGFLRAVSVGFIPRDYRWEKRNGVEVLVLYGNSLREISVTPVPANHEALAKMRAVAIGKALQASLTKTDGSPVTQEKQMDEETKKAFAAKDAELTSIRSEFEAATKSLEKAKADLEKATADLDVSAKALAEATAKATENAARAEAAEKEAVSLREQVAKAADEMLVRDVDSIVGVKITPAQKDEFLALARKDRGIYDNIVKGLADLNILGGPIVATKDVATLPTSGDLADLIGDVSSDSPRGDGSSDLADLL
jgi:HK97 family phage prohead protease